MRVIVISGKAGHGKDTLAKIIHDRFDEKGKAVLITHFADLLKFMCVNLFGWDGKKDEGGRHLLQYVGTDIIRKRRPDFWVDFIADVLDIFQSEWDYVIIPDCRFPNEIDRLKERGYQVTHVHVVRPGFDGGLTSEARAHVSETALDDVKPDYTVFNTGTVDDLAKRVAAKIK